MGANFECQSCGTIIHKNYSVYDKELTSPERCSCGNKRNFKIVSKNLLDIRKIKIKEFEKVIGLSPPLIIWLSEEVVDLCGILNKKDKIKIKGIIRTSPNQEKNPYFLEAKNISKI